MSEIKIIEIGKATILAYLLPQDASNVRFRFNRFLTFRRSNSSHVELFNDRLELIGLSTEITEEQARELVPKLGGKLFDGDLNNYYSYPDYMTVNHPFDSKQFETAKESLTSLLQANQIYSVNPCGEKPDMFNSLINRTQWQEAEASTGNYLILTKL